MEALPINNNNGQAHGYILYSTNVHLNPDAKLKIRGHVRYVVGKSI
ncbi:hypothetical protein E2C01_066860 [Portunus trituberculatus]|uniref:Uncharacterized protein n=1 Tax=Portunus trituberculatus TaxID=210409 RepID=A0A5B7HS18_PORTR|nr:hypothetical protein [Portunus trituberculatus]